MKHGFFDNAGLAGESKLSKKLDLEKYEREGVDISLITSNLSRTPTERAEANLGMLKFMEEARKSREKRTNTNTKT